MEEILKLQKIMEENGWTHSFLRTMVRAMENLRDVELAVSKNKETRDD